MKVIERTGTSQLVRIIDAFDEVVPRNHLFNGIESICPGFLGSQESLSDGQVQADLFVNCLTFALKLLVVFVPGCGEELGHNPIVQVDDLISNGPVKLTV